MSLEEDANKVLRYLYDRRMGQPTVVRPDEIGIERSRLKLAQEKLNSDSLAKLNWMERLGHADGKILPEGITKIEGSSVPKIVAGFATTATAFPADWAKPSPI